MKIVGIGPEGEKLAARSPRRRVVLPATAVAISGTYRCTMRNVSATGAMLEGERLPEPKREILLEAAGLELICRTVWTKEGRCGVAFDEPIPQATVLALSRITPESDEAAAWRAAAEWARPSGRGAFLD